MKKVFLGGTCNGSLWREELIPQLKINYFNPVVDHWNNEAYERELKERQEADYCLYVINPKMIGYYSIAEAVDDSNKKPEKTILVIQKKYENQSFSKEQWKSLQAVAKLIHKNGATVLDDLKAAADYLNSQ